MSITVTGGGIVDQLKIDPTTGKTYTSAGKTGGTEIGTTVTAPTVTTTPTASTPTNTTIVVQGTEIVSAQLVNTHLIFTLSDGTTLDAGILTGVAGGFTPVSPLPSLPDAATDLASTITLLNSIRSAMISNGLATPLVVLQPINGSAAIVEAPDTSTSATHAHIKDIASVIEASDAMTATAHISSVTGIHDISSVMEASDAMIATGLLKISAHTMLEEYDSMIATGHNPTAMLTTHAIVAMIEGSDSATVTATNSVATLDNTQSNSTLPGSQVAGFMARATTLDTELSALEAS